ncbi:MAG: sulfite exporter TauE/SafE family protein [Planctomycetota bacterium]
MPPIDLWLLLQLAIVLSLGIFVQSAAGFAAGMLIVSVMLFCGHAVPEAAVALLIATVPQNLMGVWKFRDHIDVRQVAWPALGRFLLLPVGVECLAVLETGGPALIKRFVGCVMILVTIAILAFRPRPVQRLHPAWAWLAFPLSGFLQGLIGMGGPAMVYWVQAHDWGTQRSRGFLFAMYLANVFPGIAVLVWRFPDRVGPMALHAICVIPVVLLVIPLGLETGTRLGRQRLRMVAMALLLVIGVTALVFG